MVGLNL